MATAVFTTCPHILAAILDFSEILFFSKLQQILLELVENMWFLPQIQK